MKKSIISAAAAVGLLAAAQPATICGAERTNPFLAPYGTPYDIPPFDRITYDDYLPALRQGIEEYKQEIDAITKNRARPDFDNTVLAMEKAGKLMNRVMLVFSSLDETDNTPEMTAISEVAYPLVSQTTDEIMMNEALFRRVKDVYDSRDKLNLDKDQKRAVEELYKKFVRSGALLPADKKEELKKINTTLTDLYLKFNKNLLAATNAYTLEVTDEKRLAGIPASNIATAAEEAKARGKQGWVFTLHAPSRLPLLQYASDRDLRRDMYQAYINLASEGEFDNKPVINEILKGRSAKAKLLGYPDFATYMTENVMARTPDNAENLLLQIWQPAVARVKEEVSEMQALADREGAGITIEPWDYYYYAEKVRKDKYDLDEDEVRAYFPLENVRKGIFSMAERLYGVKFTEMPDAPKYNPEVKVYDVTDAASGEHVAVFMTDYFPRASKRQGAWMSEFQGAYSDPDGSSARPIVYNVGNFSKPSADTPSLLTLDEVETMFHEFGHGLHGMLTRARLRSQAGTNVDRDFVELPSQITEHWAMEPELLKTYARHYKTGEVIPDELIKKLDAAATHNQGFTTTELVGAALLDLQWGKLNPGGDVDVAAFEKEVASKLGMPSQVQFRYRSPYFRHIFGSDGYASGYYTYLWAEVLDCDGFELFKEKGVFDPATAKAFKENVLEMGGSDDPMELYIKFRGHQPNVDALLRNRGLYVSPTDKDANTKINTPGGK
ncbi:MAG: M3 family metallopeptidase [Muribaculaceae bacterium]|nr:M3 family metallopeptidase [Muribaculaceae bacterium]